FFSCCRDAGYVSCPFFVMGVIPTAPSHHIRLTGKSRAPISCLGWPATRSSSRAALRAIHVASYRGIVGIQTETGIPPGARILQLAPGGRTLPGRRNLALVPDPNVRGVPEPVHQRRLLAWRHEPRLAERLDLDAVRPEADDVTAPERQLEHVALARIHAEHLVVDEVPDAVEDRLPVVDLHPLDGVRMAGDYAGCPGVDRLVRRLDRPRHRCPDVLVAHVEERDHDVVLPGETRDIRRDRLHVQRVRPA